MIVKKIVLGNPAIVRKEVKLPNGKTIVFARGIVYKTSDPKELELFSKMHGFQLVDLNEVEVRQHLEKLPVVPTIDIKLDEEEVKKHIWFDEAEEYVLETLIKSGKVEETVGADREEILKARKVARMSGLKNEELLEELAERDLIPRSGPEVITDMTDEDMIKALRKNGWSGFRQPKKK